MNFTDALEWMRESEDNVIVSRDEDGASYMKLSGDFLRCNDTNSKGYWPIAEIGSWMLDADWRPVVEEEPPKGRLLNPIGCPPFNPSKEEPKHADKMSDHEAWAIIYDMIRASGQTDAQARALLVPEPRVEPKACEHPFIYQKYQASFGDGVIYMYCPDCNLESVGKWLGGGDDFYLQVGKDRVIVPHLNQKRDRAEIEKHLWPGFHGDGSPRPFYADAKNRKPKGCEHDWGKDDPSSVGALICQKCGEKWHWFDWLERATALTNWTITPSPLSAGDKPVAKGFAPEPDPIAPSLRPGRHNRGGEA